MADKKLTELTAATAPLLADSIYIVQGGTPKKITIPNLLNKHDVRWYGAMGNGITDDTAAFQAALNAMVAGDQLIIPNGTYKVGALTKTGVDYLSIIGVGNPYLAPAAGVIDLLTFTNCHWPTLKGFTISGGTTCQRSIYLNGCYWAILDSLVVMNFSHYGVETLNTWWLTTRDCYFNGTGAVMAGFASFYHGNNNNAVVHTRSRFVGDTGSYAAIIHGGAATTFIGCDFGGDLSAGNKGLWIQGGTSINLYGCYFEGVAEENVIIDGGDMVEVRGSHFNLMDADGQIGIAVNRGYSVLIAANNFVGGAHVSTGVYVGPTTLNYRVSEVRIDNTNSFSTTNLVTDVSGRADSMLSAVGYPNRREKFGTSGVPMDGTYYIKGSIIWNSNPTTGQPVGWVCTSPGIAAPAWITGTPYPAGSVIEGGAPDWNVYYTVLGGVSGANCPVHGAGTVSDDGGGGVLWTFMSINSAAAVFKAFGTIA